jgi:flagellar basal-body rod modification protein FlgD
MTTLSTATSTSSQSTGTQSSSAGSSNTALTEQDFLQMLVAQLEDQNPLSPSSPQDLANEFAEMSTVTGINNLDTEVSQIQTGGAAAELAQAAGLVGQTVAIPGNTLTPAASGKAQGAFSLSSSASSATVSIFNASGALVGTVPLQNLSAGLNSFTWSEGTSGQSYTFSVTASGTSGAAVTATTYSAAQVQTVDLSQSSPSVSVGAGEPEVPLSSIAGILGG